MKHFTHALVLLIASCFCLPTAADQQWRVAFAQDDMANDFRKAQVLDAQREALNYPEIEFVYSDAEGQTSLLIHQIDRFIKQKVDALIIGTNDENAVVPVISKAHHAGIVVIIVDRGVNTTDYTTFINSDNIFIGTIAGNYIARLLNGRGRVLLFEGIQTADVTRLRSQGFLEAMAKFPGIEVIRRTGNYLRKDAVVEMEKLLAEGISVDAIFAESDSMISGARMVLSHHGIHPGSIITVGCDYISEAREAIREGTQTGSVLFPLGGAESVRAAVKALSGEQIDSHVVIPVRLITKDNVEQVEPVF